MYEAAVIIGTVPVGHLTCNEGDTKSRCNPNAKSGYLLLLKRNLPHSRLQRNLISVPAKSV